MIRKEDVIKLIVEERKNTFLSHLKIFFSWDFTQYYGEIKKDKVLLWTSSYWLRLNYPVFVLHFNEEEALKAIKLEKNPFNKVIGKFIPLSIGGLIIFLSFILQLRAAIIISLVILCFSLVFYLLINRQLNFEKRNLLSDLKEELFQLERDRNPSLALPGESETNPSKEWTFSKILLRVILYPFCLGLVYISITLMLPSEKPYLGLVGIGIGLSYLISDIRLSIKRLQPKKYKQNA